MNSNFLKNTLCLGGLCTFSLQMFAAPFHPADISANPAWVLHLDCDALRPTTIGQYILSEMDKPEAKAKLAAFQTIFNFDLRNQLHGATLYGSSPASDDGVLIIYADFDPARITTLAQATKDYQSSQHGPTIIHNWIDEKKEAKDGVKPRIYAAIQGNRIIFGQREDRVAQALDVLSGSSPNLSASKLFSELGVSGAKHFLEAAARKMKLPDSDPNAAILKLSQTVQLVMGESQQQFSGDFTLVADNDELAGNVLSIAQGLVSLAKFQNDKPESAKIANAITFTKNSDRVAGNLALPASEVVEMMKADAARKAAAKAAKE